MAMRTEKELDEQLIKAMDYTMNDATAVKDMTYEQGVEYALRWALGSSDDLPIETDYDEEDY